MLKYTSKTYTTCKKGNTENENEDAFILTYPSSESIVRIAVSDGATESSFSKEWAEFLVRYFAVFDFDNETFFSLLHPSLRRQWLSSFNLQDLPWFAQEKIEMGAFATFLGTSISLNSGECAITAVGDSNFIVFRGGNVILKFPVENAIDFGSSPFLLSSVLERNKKENRYFFYEEVFTIKSGDLLIMGTDAISQWILLQEEKNLNPYETLIKIFLEELDFINWLNEQRIESKIKNDDTTLVILKFE